MAPCSLLFALTCPETPTSLSLSHAQKKTPRSPNAGPSLGDDCAGDDGAGFHFRRGLIASSSLKTAHAQTARRPTKLGDFRRGVTTETERDDSDAKPRRFQRIPVNARQFTS